MTKTAVLFNPQVVVQPGDYRDLYDGFPEARERLGEAGEILGFDLAARFFAADPAKINDGQVVRPASVALAVALHELAGTAVRPDVIGGLSLGSIVAAHVGGFLTFRDAIRMTHLMPRIEDEIAGGQGLGVAFYYNVDPARVQAEMAARTRPEGLLSTCAITADNQMIVTGHVRALEDLNAWAAGQGGVGLVIPYGPPAHTQLPIMERIRDRFDKQWRYQDDIRDATVPQLCNHTGELVTDRTRLARTMVEQYVRPVRWDVAVRRLAEHGVTAVRIIGPGHFVYKSLQFTAVPFEVETYLGAPDLAALDRR